VRYEAGLSPLDTAGLAGLAQVLAGETRRQEIHFRLDTRQRTDVIEKRNAWKTLFEHRLRGGVDLAEEACRMARPMEAELDAADSGEQTGNLQGLAAPDCVGFP